jgi:hypothetical protein
VAREAPKITIAMKTGKEYANYTPGPGAYDATNLRSTDQRPPSYTMRLKTAPPDGRIAVPGPGAYDHRSRILNTSSPNIRIGTSKRDEFGGTLAPGPGAYNMRPGSAYGGHSGPKYGFGTNRRDRDPLHEMSKTLPGPGAYNTRGSLDAHGTSLVPRRPDSAQLYSSHIPGPGAYTPSLTHRPKSPQVRIGTSSRDGFGGDRNQPGPGQYDPRLFKSAPAFKVGTSVRPPLNQATATPGPGNYNLTARSVEGPKYHMSPRLDNLGSKDRVPGPGTYSPRVDYTKEKGNQIRIGSASREGWNINKTAPGPGQYDTRRGLGGPKWGFGSSNRDGFRGNAEPGPGHYNLPPKFADVPKYAYGSSPMKIRL